MLSYRHSFHAGNPADVLKHLVLFEVLKYLTKKDKSFEYIDTHSGAGMYAFSSSEAQKTQEFEQGIAKLWAYSGDNQAIIDYLDLIKGFNQNELSFYPGSPAVAHKVLRAQDKSWLFELHPQDHGHLSNNFRPTRKRKVRKEDGFQGLLGLLPPLSRRACVLIDPPYEIKSDYELVVKTVATAYKKFATGTYMIWYPVVDRERIEKMEASLIESGIKNVHLYELGTSKDTEEHGMTASGMVVINPPWNLSNTMDSVMPELVELLSNDDGFYRSVELVSE